MHIILRAFLCLAIMLSPVAQAKNPADASEIILPQIDNLRIEAALAREQNLPLLIMFSSEHCRYCSIMADEFLKPMMFTGEYQDKILFRQLNLSARAEIIDFDGSPIKVREFARRYKIRLTPTLIFLDHSGQQAAPAMVGLSTPDYFGSYLDTAINTAHTYVRAKRTTADRASLIKVHPNATADALQVTAGD
ncbi:MAG: thioredoxin fold domain-containing protein [Thiohalomonadaceae bacterium]|jgi:thioredoxin-related protein